MKLKLKSKIQKSDFFAYIPPEPGKRQGKLGAIISIVIILAFIGYSLARFITFITDPTVNYAQEYIDTSENDNATLPQLAIAIASDSTYTDLSSKVVISAVFNSSNNGTPNTYLQTTECDSTTVPSYMDKLNFFCFTPSVIVPGTRLSQIENQRDMMITIIVTDCEGFLSSLPVSLYAILPNQFDVDLRYRSFTNKTGSVFVERIRLQPPLLAFWGLDFQQQQYTISPDYLVNFRTMNHTRLVIFKVRTSYGEQPGCVNNMTVLTLMEFSLDSQIELTFINYETITDLFSELGALWTTSILILGQLFIRYNKHQHEKSCRTKVCDNSALDKSDREHSKHCDIKIENLENSFKPIDNEKANMMDNNSVEVSITNSIDLGKSASKAGM